MKVKRSFFIIVFVGLLLNSCTYKTENVFRVDQLTIDASFKGARLNSFKHIGNNNYVAEILPENEPINKSPYFAFSIKSKTIQEIVVTLNYGKYKHRYIPKLSYDKVHWKNIEEKNIKIDTLTGEAHLKLKVSPQILYVAAQEIETSKDTYLWLKNLLKEHPYLTKKTAGKSVKGESVYVVNSENKNIKNTVVLIARQHPPETPGGTIGFKVFFEEIMSNTPLAKTFRENFNIYTFPLLNPDGVDLGNWRHNANGKDINRDWVDFSQPETQIVRGYIASKVAKDQKIISYAIDFHTSYSGPYLLVLDSVNQKKVKGLTSKWIKSIEQNSEFKVEARQRSQELPYCYNWFYNTFNAEAITYEDGDEIDRTIIRERAKIYAINFMKTLNSNYENDN